MGTTSAARTGWSRLASLSVAIGLLTLVVALGFGAAVPLGIATRSAAGSTIGQVVAVLPFAVVGALLAARQPRNPISWTMLGAAAFLVLQGVASLYSVLD
jgi:hypothetical protein